MANTFGAGITWFIVNQDPTTNLPFEYEVTITVNGEELKEHVEHPKDEI